MKVFKESTIVTPNKPGKLAQALRAVANAGVNLIAIDSSSGYDLNMVRLVTSDPARARWGLEKLGYNVTESAVLGVTVSDKPGQLARIASIFSKSHVNIEYMYASAAAYDQPAMVIVHVADAELAEKVLRAAKIA
ncbi:MAG TPA: ACT domain-containing protein [Verrucomicrobiae bacterium]|nr:ACT domain-containing protein [Verrucomicrobiae bacterium]